MYEISLVHNIWFDMIVLNYEPKSCVPMNYVNKFNLIPIVNLTFQYAVLYEKQVLLSKRWRTLVHWSAIHVLGNGEINELLHQVQVHLIHFYLQNWSFNRLRLHQSCFILYLLDCIWATFLAIQSIQLGLLSDLALSFF